MSKCNLKKIFSVLMIFIVIFAFNVNSFAKDDDKYRSDKEKVEQILKKYNGRVKFLSDSEVANTKVLQNTNIKTPEELEAMIDKQEKIINEIYEGINKAKKFTSEDLSEIQPMTSGHQIVTEWFQLESLSGLGILNQYVEYTYTYGKPPAYPNDTNHNYLVSGDYLDIWLSNTVLASIHKVGNPSYSFGMRDPQETTIHNTVLNCSYTYYCTYGIPSPWGTVGPNGSGSSHSFNATL